jgi:hypothetical protein
VEGSEQSIKILLGHGTSDEEGGVDQGQVLGVLEQFGLLVVDWEAVSRAVYDANELRDREEEVDELGNEEEHESLGEVALDCGHGQGHSSEVREGISDEDLRRIRIEVGQRQHTAQEGKHQIQAVHVLLAAWTAQLDVVVSQNRKRNYNRLRRLKSFVPEK